MYTQCPDCDTVFRVTAHALQQGAGRVRCESCGQPFNALERLSEDAPRSAREDARSMLDELDALAGPDEVRIEDTGVEWRVVDDDDLETSDTAAEPEETDSSSVRWFIEEPGQESAGNDAAVAGNGEAPLRQASDEDSADHHEIQHALRLPGAGGGEELRYDDNTPLPEDFDDGPESAEPPRRRAEDFIEPRSPEFDERQVDLALGEPGEWMELLDELDAGDGDSAEEAQHAALAELEDTHSTDLADTDVRLIDEEDAEAGDDFPRDIDTQFDLQALEMGIELTGNNALAADDDDGWSLAAEGDTPDVGPPETAEADEEDEAVELRLVEDEAPEPERTIGVPAAAAADDAEEAQARKDADAGIRLEDQPPAPPASPGEREMPVRSGAPDGAENEPPPLTEEELTINRLIDQDLIRFAEEQEALSSTGSGERRAPREIPLGETIIMEGELVRTAVAGEEDSAAPGDSRANLEAERLMDTWLADRTATREEPTTVDWRSWGAIAAAAVLALLLLGQVVHDYRDSLAMNAAFARAAGPVYRFLGDPLVPSWDARRWQFQATNGSTDASGDVLSISSRIANTDDRALPYPLIYLSLSDRWEEPVGASVLEPLDYLPSGADSTDLVPAGESFTAAITIRALSPNATGFKLNVCYPADAGRLRCAIEDFRN